MANVRELMAKMTPHGSSLSGIGRGAPELTQHDIAAALGMGHINPLQSDLLRVKFCHDQTSEWSLVRRWWDRIHDMGIRRDWPRPDKDHMTWFILSYASLYDHCREPKCRVCDGTKHRLVGAKVIVCGACGGNGRGGFSGRLLANWASVPETTWRRLYAPLLGDCGSELQSVEDHAIRRVAPYFRENQEILA